MHKEKNSKMSLKGFFLIINTKKNLFFGIFSWMLFLRILQRLMYLMFFIDN
jgi:hypothetical protein